MHYSDELDEIIKTELDNLIKMKEKNEGPFDRAVVEKYYEKYKEITNMK